MTEALSPTLSDEERREHADDEAIIERGRKTFLEVGAALGRIRDRRSYRETHGTFEEYCQDRWGYTRQHANRIVMAADIRASLEPMGSTLPESERQVRELSKVPAEQRAEVWQEAVKRNDGKPAPARVVAEIIKERQAPDNAPLREALDKCEVEVSKPKRGDDPYIVADEATAARAREVLGDRLEVQPRDRPWGRSSRSATA